MHMYKVTLKLVKKYKSDQANAQIPTCHFEFYILPTSGDVIPIVPAGVCLAIPHVHVKLGLSSSRIAKFMYPNRYVT